MKTYPLEEGMGLNIMGTFYKVTSVRTNGMAVIKPRGKLPGQVISNPILTLKKPWWRKIWNSFAA